MYSEINGPVVAWVGAREGTDRNWCQRHTKEPSSVVHIQLSFTEYKLHLKLTF